MSWEVRIPKRVKKTLIGLSKEDRARIIQALREFVIDPWVGDITKILGEKNLWRRRIGNYRIFYFVQVGAKTIEVEEIARRTSNTY